MKSSKFCLRAKHGLLFITFLTLMASCQPAPSSNKEKGTGKDDAVATGCATKFTGVWDQVGCFNSKTNADMECPGASLSKGLKRRIRFYENSTKATLSTIGDMTAVPGLPPINVPEDPPEKALPIDSACNVGTKFGKYPLRMEGSSLLYCLGKYCEKLTEVDSATNPQPSSAPTGSAECGGAQYTASGPVTGLQNNFGFAPTCAFLGLGNLLYPSLSLNLSPYGEKKEPAGMKDPPHFNISFISAKAVAGQVYNLSKSTLEGIIATGNLEAKYYAADANNGPTYHSCEGTIKFVQIPKKAGDWFEAELNIKMSAEHLQCTPGQIDKTLQGTIKLQAQRDAQY